jgi:hypothetical protein
MNNLIISVQMILRRSGRITDIFVTSAFWLTRIVLDIRKILTMNIWIVCVNLIYLMKA